MSRPRVGQFLSVITTICLLSFAPLVDGRVAAWYDFFHHSNDDPLQWQAPSMPTQYTQKTDVTAPTTTTPPQAAEVELLLMKRADKRTCGFLDGKAESPYTCGSGRTCSYFDSTSAVGCCNEGTTSCHMPTACFDLIASQRGSCSSMWPGTGCCGDTAHPYCATVNFVDMRSTMVYCLASPGTPTLKFYYSATTDSKTSGTSKAGSTTSSNSALQTALGVGTTGATQTPEPEKKGLSEDGRVAMICSLAIGIPATLGTIYAAWKVRGRRH